MKGVGIPEHYLGGNVEQMDEVWLKENIQIGLSARTYIENLISKFEGLYLGEIKKYKTYWYFAHCQSDTSGLVLQKAEYCEDSNLWIRACGS